MSLRIEEMLVESDLDLDEMGEVVDTLAPLGELSDASPVPSAELEELFSATTPPAPVAALLGSRRGAVAGALVLALSGVGATGLSAAANTLPRPLQHSVSQFSQRYLPFDLPEPPKHAKSPLGIEAVPPSYPTPDAGRASSEPTSRSTPGRDPVVGAYPKGRPAQEPAASPSASPSYSAFAASPSTQPSTQPSPDDSSSASNGSGGRPAASPSDHPADQKPGKGAGKGGHDDKGHAHGPGGSDPGPQGDPATAPVPGGQDPVPTGPSPLPDLPLPTVPLPDPLPDLGPLGTGTVDPGADAG